MGAYSGMRAFYGDLAAIARDLGYSEANILILEGDQASLQAQYPEIWQNILSCRHQRDRRSFMEYAQDLVASWIAEDSIVGELQNAGLQISLAGADCRREILPNTRVSASSDTQVTYNGHTTPVELMCDYTGYWSRYGKIDLRDDKYMKMKNSSSLFLGISTPDRKYILIDFRGNTQSRYIPEHRPYGGKPCYSTPVPSGGLKDYSIDAIKNDIIAALQ